jgi:hypothetical protein
MKTQTQELLRRLDQATWFAAVGQPVEGSSVLSVSSWPEAIKRSRDKRWKRLVNSDMSNKLSKRLRIDGPDPHAEWNAAIQVARPLVDDLMKRKFPGRVPDEMAETVEDQLFWTLLHAFAEQEFAEVLAPGFYTELAEWYCRGHFPCGWEGKPSQGQLVVY